jgi:hypothetical protein
MPALVATAKRKALGVEWGGTAPRKPTEGLNGAQLGGTGL